jgi:hypothetical protein
MVSSLPGSVAALLAPAPDVDKELRPRPFAAAVPALFGTQ